MECNDEGCLVKSSFACFISLIDLALLYHVYPHFISARGICVVLGIGMLTLNSDYTRFTKEHVRGGLHRSPSNTMGACACAMASKCERQLIVPPERALAL